LVLWRETAPLSTCGTSQSASLRNTLSYSCFNSRLSSRSIQMRSTLRRRSHEAKWIWVWNMALTCRHSMPLRSWTDATIEHSFMVSVHADIEVTDAARGLAFYCGGLGLVLKRRLSATWIELEG